MDVSRAMIEPLPWEPPAIGEAVDAAEGIRWIRHVVPGALRHINVWLLPARTGYVLVDTGMNLPETVQAWDRLIERERLRDELRGLIITHYHPDHFGMAGYLTRRLGISARMSAPGRTAIEYLLAGGSSQRPAVMEAYREKWGFDFRDLLARGEAGMGTFTDIVSGLPGFAAPLKPGATPDELRDPWEVSLHFGHAEGHACLHWEQGGMFVSGDQLLPTISSNISLYPDVVSSDPLGDFFASLDQMDRLPPDTIVLPAHGLPFRGVQARVAAVRAEHEGRLVEIERFCAERREVDAIVTVLFGRRKLDGVNRLLAYGETLAHIRHLEIRGRVARVVHDGTIKWVRP